MTTPKWMLGLMACASLLIAQCDDEGGCKDDSSGCDSGCPQTAVTLDEE